MSSDIRRPGFAENAWPTFTVQTGLHRDHAHFSVVRTNASGGYDHIVARPYNSRESRTYDPDRWWVFDEDIDETEGWVAQAVFTPDGFIARAWVCDEFHRVMDDAPDEDESPPRDLNAPVTVSIDLEDHEVAEREGIPAWEEHGPFAVLLNENGFAVIHASEIGGGVGIVRYPDKTSCSIKCSTVREARNQAEKFLANRPYKNAYQRVLGEPDFDAPDPPPEKDSFDPPTSPAVPRAKPEKRVWSTVPLTSGEDDD